MARRILDSKYGTSKDFLPPIKDIVNILADILDDPEHPAYCAYVIVGFSRLLFDHGTFQQKASFDKHHHPLNTIMRFLAFEKMSDTPLIGSLTATLGKCQCCILPGTLLDRAHGVGTSQLHNRNKIDNSQATPPHPRNDTLILDMISDLIRLPVAALQDANNAGKKRALKWPSNSSSLLPFGSAALLRSMSLSLTLLSSLEPLHLLSEVLHNQGRSFAVDVVSSVDFRDAFLSKFRKTVHLLLQEESASRLYQLISGNITLICLFLVKDLFRACESRGFIERLFVDNVNEYCLLFYHCVSKCRASKIVPLLEYMTDSQNPNPFHVFKYLLLFCIKLPTRTIVHSGIENEVDEGFTDTYNSLSGATSHSSSFKHKAVARGLVRLRNSRSCFVVSCEHPAGKDVKACARCGVVYYCSKECQTLDWTNNAENGDYCHKTVCRAIRTFIQAAGNNDFLKSPEKDLEVYDCAIGEDAATMLFEWQMQMVEMKTSVGEEAYKAELGRLLFLEKFWSRNIC